MVRNDVPQQHSSINSTVVVASYSGLSSAYVFPLGADFSCSRGGEVPYSNDAKLGAVNFTALLSVTRHNSTVVVKKKYSHCLEYQNKAISIAAQNPMSRF